MLGKKGVMGSGIMTIYRLVIVSLVALVILGISSVFYVHYIDVRDAEAIVMGREVVECISPSGVLDFAGLRNGDFLLDCGYDSAEISRFYVGVDVFDSSGVELGKVSSGDSGTLWIKKFFDKVKAEGETKKYRPGYSNENYPSFVLVDGKKVEGNFNVEVLVINEI